MLDSILEISEKISLMGGKRITSLIDFVYYLHMKFMSKSNMTMWKLNKIVKHNCTQIGIFSMNGAFWSELFRATNRAQLSFD